MRVEEDLVLVLALLFPLEHFLIEILGIPDEAYEAVAKYTGQIVLGDDCQILHIHAMHPHHIWLHLADQHAVELKFVQFLYTVFQ